MVSEVIVNVGMPRQQHRCAHQETLGLDTLEEPPEQHGIGHIGRLRLTRTTSKDATRVKVGVEKRGTAYGGAENLGSQLRGGERLSFV